MFKVKVNNTTYRVQFNQSDGLELSGGNQIPGTVDGTAFGWNMVEYAPGCFHIVDGNRSFKAELLKADVLQKCITIRVNGKKFTANIYDQYDLLLERMGMTAGSRQAAKDVRAPMPGLVIEVVVQEGSPVIKGDPLVILEAMKMENVLKAPGNAKVKEVLVTKGEKVEKNQVLVVFK